MNDNVQLCISKEISKKFEEHKTGLSTEVYEYFSKINEIQGEYVICININEIKNKTNNR